MTPDERRHLEQELDSAQAEVARCRAQYDAQRPVSVILFDAAVLWRDTVRRRLYSQRKGDHHVGE